ncbi:hypothetical protein D3C78_1010950 [compost metagenome]
MSCPLALQPTKTAGMSAPTVSLPSTLPLRLPATSSVVVPPASLLAVGVSSTMRTISWSLALVPPTPFTPMVMLSSNPVGVAPSLLSLSMVALRV